MATRKLAIALMAFILCGLMGNAQIGMLKESVVVMEETELKIERGSCFVYWRPVFCTYPGTGYRLEVKNGGRKGKNKVRSYAIFFDDRDALASLVKRDPGADWEGQIHLEARSVLRVTLRGEPGAGITLRIWGEANKVYASRVVGWPQITEVGRMQTGVIKAPERPQPVIALEANRDAIEIGQFIRLKWDAQNAATVRFTSGDLGWVEKSGSAMVWPEKDTKFRVEAREWSNVAVAEATVRVSIPEPELELKAEPATVLRGEEVTFTWKTKNARIVRYGERELYSYLPLHGKQSVKPNDSCTYTVQAENGDKSTRKTFSVKVLDPEIERQRIEREKMSRNIPPAIDRSLRGIWAGFKEALRAGDADKVAGFFCLEDRAEYLRMYNDLKEKLPQVGAEMGGIEFIEFQGDGAKYRTKRKETLKGKEYDITYYVYFVIDQDGQWRIYRF
jgi:hypothetical protein